MIRATIMKITPKAMTDLKRIAKKKKVKVKTRKCLYCENPSAKFDMCLTHWFQAGGDYA